MKRNIIFLFFIFISIAQAKNYRTVNFKPFKVVMPDSQIKKAWQEGEGPMVSPKFQKSLDEITKSEMAGGNEAMLLVNGMMSYKMRYQLIETAKKTIVLSVLSIHKEGGRNDSYVKDPYTRRMVEGLIAAKKRGVKVLMIYDGVASYMGKSQKAIDLLAASGIKVIKYNPYIGQKRDSLGFIPLDIINLIRKFIFLSKFKKQSLFFNRWHDKTMIVDSHYAILGGINWGEKYALGNAYSAGDYSFKEFLMAPLARELRLPEIYNPNEGWGIFHPQGWRDTDILVHGPVVKKIQKTLLKDILSIRHSMKRKHFKFQYIGEDVLKKVEKEYKDKFENNPDWMKKKDPPNGRLLYRVRYLSQRPFLYMGLGRHKDLIEIAQKNKLYINRSKPNAYVSNFYINMINKAQYQILWGSFSLGPDDEVLKALTNAAKRGVQIYLITNSIETSKTLGDKGFITYRRNKRIYKKLINAGKGLIRIFEWQDKFIKNNELLTSGVFHSKSIDIDGVVSIIGSYNMSRASFHHHSESVVAIFGPSFSKKNQLMYQNDFKYTKEVILK